MEPVQIHFLGTGDAFSAGGRQQAAYLIQSSRGSLLLDCGSTALAALKRYDLPVSSIDRILLSHLHGDHFAGLPFFLLHYVYVEPRAKPLKIIGPEGLKGRVELIFRAMYPDSASVPLSYDIEFIELHPGRPPLSMDELLINPFRVPHQKQPLSLGFEIRVDGRKIVYSGDTGWTEDLVARSQNADLLICECSFFETRMETHLDYPRIADNKERFGAKRVILTHLGHEVLRRQQEVGLELAHDGLVVTL
jgi:ribonuclease BN (tRNA processing enzyme)